MTWFSGSGENSTMAAFALWNRQRKARRDPQQAGRGLRSLLDRACGTATEPECAMKHAPADTLALRHPRSSRSTVGQCFAQLRRVIRCGGTDVLDTMVRWERAVKDHAGTIKWRQPREGALGSGAPAWHADHHHADQRDGGAGDREGRVVRHMPSMVRPYTPPMTPLRPKPSSVPPSAIRQPGRGCRDGVAIALGSSRLGSRLS